MGSRQYSRWALAALVTVPCALAVAAWLNSAGAYAIEASYDFGILYPNEAVSHRFVLVNPADVPMRIREVKKDCACVGIKLEKRTVEPGKQVSADVYLQTRDYPEHLKSRTLIVADAGGKPITYALMLRADSEDILSFPNGSGNIFLPNVSAAQLPNQASIDIKRGKYPLEFASMSCRVLSSDSLFVDIRAKDKDTWTFNATIPEDVPYGTIYAPLEFVLVSKDGQVKFRKRKAIVTGVSGPVMPDPPSVLFGTIKLGEQAAQVIRVVAATPGGAEVPRIVDASVRGADDVTASMELDASTGRPQVKAVLSGKGLPGPRSGAVMIRLEGDSGHLLSVAYLGMVTDGEGKTPQ